MQTITHIIIPTAIHITYYILLFMIPLKILNDIRQDERKTILKEAIVSIIVLIAILVVINLIISIFDEIIIKNKQDKIQHNINTFMDKKTIDKNSNNITINAILEKTNIKYIKKIIIYTHIVFILAIIFLVISAVFIYIKNIKIAKQKDSGIMSATVELGINLLFIIVLYNISIIGAKSLNINHNNIVNQSREIILKSLN